MTAHVGAKCEIVRQKVFELEGLGLIIRARANRFREEIIPEKSSIQHIWLCISVHYSAPVSTAVPDKIRQDFIIVSMRTINLVELTTRKSSLRDDFGNGK